MTNLFDIEKLCQGTETDIQIAHYISNNEESVAFMRVRELAEETHVSPATIVRFTQKMGYESFPELRLAIKQNLEKRHIMINQNANEFYLENTHFPIDFKENIDFLVAKLNEVDVIHCLGTGSSSSMAQYAQQRLSSLGYQSFASVSTFIPYLASKKDKTNEKINEVCLLFSVSGETPDLIHIAKALVGTSIYSISVTNKSTNTLATLCDFSLSYDTPLNRRSYSVDMSSQLPVVYIIETLSKELYNKKFPFKEDNVTKASSFNK